MKTTVYSAKNIVTMNAQKPDASHVAVRDGRILAVGSSDEVATWGPYELDEQFADKVLFPGLVEGHAHTMEGTLWRYVYCGYFDRMDPSGTTHRGNTSIDAVLEALKAAEAKMDDPDSPLTGWQLDPIYLDNKPVTRAQLDNVSATRPIGVLNASGHILYANSKALELASLLKKGVNHPGIPLGADGLPTGELKGPDAMAPVSVHVGMSGSIADVDERGLRDFARLCVRTGVTTVTDLAAKLDPDSVDMMLRVTGEPSFPACVVPLRFFLGLSPKELVPEVARLKKLSTDRLSLGRIKLVADGSIQGYSARLRWPGYHNGAPNGLWYVTPEQMLELYELALEAGLQIHTHTNGDQATQLAIEKLELALRKHPSNDHRFVLQHCQLADRAQFTRMAALGMSVNLFANHQFYWGDEHYTLTVGPDRALRMNAARTALDCGVPLAVHSDAPITPLGPFFTAWCAVNRLTRSGRVQGEHEKITVDEALWAITMGAAHSLHMDGLVGSIEVGKRADFAVLESDPRAANPEEIKDVEIWGTVQGGRVFAAADV
ncbi:MAG: amidohydrolase [Planktotalea sp.]|jgi:predicted amidohydrolase YtcJ|uniref:amidohydrolase n=1 Tax=Planktotalea sp. TaxID=2029877 RepID=UPI000183B12F|nr:amidohydrolase [Planktotalea sp.]EDZ40736.1 amidohydrolase domain protein [Rhodobacteraceae bacterium HTCC2083]MBT5821841.1 amidohydrolase [Paracoccaceae bacterium]MDG1078371.1 amidohydrolase [Planktotalea sp.]HCW85358.1 amidohydrolase [Paracoccaceae bacterium]